MKREDVGLYCLLASVFFAIVASGHVQIDTLPDPGAAIGILLTFAACLTGAAVFFNPHKKGWAVAVVVAFVVLLWDVPSSMFAAVGWQPLAFLDQHPFIGGAMFTTVRVLIAVLVLGGLGWVLGNNRVVQMPTVVYAGFLALLIASLGTSILVSEFRSVSLDVFLNWLLYVGGLYLAVATLGRVRGPRMLVETVVLASSVVAFKGVYEFLLMRQQEPTYRIFADWNNPNALAGLMAVTLPLALCLATTSDGRKRTAAILGAALIVAALALTQSLGGLLTAPIGVVALLIALISWRSGNKALPALAPLLAGIVIVGAIKLSTPAPPAQPATASTAAVEQASSSKYRTLLWRGALETFREQPVGIGVGTYRFHSARSGLNEQTHLTHQSFLQVGLEGGAVALLGLLGLGVAWIVRMFAGARALDQDRNVLRAGVFGAVIAGAANGFLESNLYYFGAGFLFFVLIGAGLQLAADGTSPESLPRPFRAFIVVACCVVPFIGVLWAMYLENAKSSLLLALDPKNEIDLRGARDQLESLAGPDGEAWYLLAWTRPTLDEEKRDLYEKAVSLAPSTRHLRALAQTQLDLGDPQGALKTLDRALEWDPNNPRTLMQKLRTHESAGQIAEAVATADRLIAVEQTPYMQTRALAEVVPTETFEARVFLAGQTTDPTERTRLLREAFDGYLRYKAVTVPKVLLFERQGLDFAGETRASAEKKMQEAREIAETLTALYSSSGDSESSSEVRELAAGLTVD